MSKLYFSETGWVVASLSEELTDYRHARKILELPPTRGQAQLYLLARAYPDTPSPLHISVNGNRIPSAAAPARDVYTWLQIPLDPAVLVAGRNVFEFWTDSAAMDSWSLALEDGHRDPQSFISNDEGETWRNEKMGYLNTARGEYVVRVRLAEGHDPTPPAMVWENPTHPRLARLRSRLPGQAVGRGTTLDRVRALMTWVCTSWEYRNLSNGINLAPWDAETILAWGQRGQGHAGREPVVMCVHYGVTFVTCCLALGIPARCAIFTGEIDGWNGHFTAEVWFQEFDKWVMVDANMDAILFKDGVPLSVSEIQAAGNDLGGLIQWGAGHDYQIKNPLLEPWIREIYLPGICFRHRSIWNRTDFISHPEFAPPHTSTSYSETHLVWETKDLEQGFGMFPYFADGDYFDAPPNFP